MATVPPLGAKPMLVGRTALIVIDIQKSAFMPGVDVGIPLMDGYTENTRRGRVVIDAARAAGIPVVFIQEAHRPDYVDFGRELDGSEVVHCLETDEGTELASEITGYRPGIDYFIRKRRYSAFYGTDLEILLKGLKAETLVLIGGLTDVCVHYTFADAHQGDYYTRVVGDCVAGSSRAAHDASLAAMEYLQTGAVVDAETIVAAFAGTAAPVRLSA